ncbi:hypothetical protein [Xanthobacter oligotrophicus]|uniref:hypothetical protein n=1 Tax=Xanthobacter oligotrophicus TaxID=2607286 RepID=UPI0011F40412|nr:hypothetical protein [Xanthobacter oligotrophicus]
MEPLGQNSHACGIHSHMLRCIGLAGDIIVVIIDRSIIGIHNLADDNIVAHAIINARLEISARVEYLLLSPGRLPIGDRESIASIDLAEQASIVGDDVLHRLNRRNGKLVTARERYGFKACCTRQRIHLGDKISRSHRETCGAHHDLLVHSLAGTNLDDEGMVAERNREGTDIGVGGDGIEPAQGIVDPDARHRFPKIHGDLGGWIDDFGIGNVVPDRHILPKHDVVDVS